MGAIADTLVAAPPPTAFEIGTRKFGMLIMRLTVFLVLFVMLANALTMKPWLESFLFAIALAVGLTPESLPMVVSITLARGWGRVINISSVNGQRGQFGQANYSAAKAGVHGFTMAAAREGASKGVTVNTISPGYVETAMVASSP